MSLTQPQLTMPATPAPLRPDDTGARILIVDDEPANVLLLQRILQNAGFTAVETLTDSREVLGFCGDSAPDIILLDLMMPHISGFEVMESLAPFVEREIYLPILVLTADVAPATRLRALTGGARDFLTKPFDHTEAVLRVKNLLETRRLYKKLQTQNVELEARVRERTRDLEHSQIEILERLARAAELRDDDTGQHTQRVGRMAAQLAAALKMDAAGVELIQRAALLHDVGKIGISDLILLKPGKLTPEEFEIIKTHTTIGATLLAEGHSPFVHMAQSIALTHHERWDGSGYPGKLAGDAIPLEGRILSVVDVFDALTNERPYKKAWPREEALAEIEKQAGRQFDPQVVAAFLAMAREF